MPQPWKQGGGWRRLGFRFHPCLCLPESLRGVGLAYADLDIRWCQCWFRYGHVMNQWMPALHSGIFWLDSIQCYIFCLPPSYSYPLPPKLFFVFAVVALWLFVLLLHFVLWLCPLPCKISGGKPANTCSNASSLHLSSCSWHILFVLPECADPYLNTDAGTMSPFEHGEVFVLDDGGEVLI
jgi:hypothetical protein